MSDSGTGGGTAPSIKWNPDTTILPETFEYADFTRVITATVQAGTAGGDGGGEGGTGGGSGGTIDITDVTVRILSPEGTLLAPNGTQEHIDIDIAFSPTNLTVTIDGQFQGVFDRMFLRYVKDELPPTYQTNQFEKIPASKTDLYWYEPDPRDFIDTKVEITIEGSQPEIKIYDFRVINDRSHNIPAILSILQNRGSSKL